MTVSKYSFGQFPSKIIKTRKAGEFICTETSYASNQKINRHFHDYASLVIVLQGGFTESFGRKTLSCNYSNLLFRPSGEIHTDYFYESGGRCLTVEISPSWLEKASEYSLNLPKLIQVNEYFLNTITPRLYREFCENDVASLLAVEGLILETIAELSRSFSREFSSLRNRRLEQAREIIHDQFSESLTIKKVAEKVSLHPVYLARAFRKKYKLTIGKYVRNLRVQKACFEILSSDKTLSQISLECGFFDQSHFSRTFKQIVGQTPTDFKKNFLKG